MSTRSVNYILSLRDRFSSSMRSVNRSIKTYNREIGAANVRTKTLTSSLSGLGIAFSAMQAVRGAAAIAKTTAEFQAQENAIRFLSQAYEPNIDSMKFVRETADKLKLSLSSVNVGYKTFIGSFAGTKVTLAEMKKMFYDVSTATAALGLSAQRQELVFLALGQMASKGIVSMEELRRQLGDSLPSAMALGARAMKMSISEFMKAVASGTVQSVEFLKAFTEEVRKEFETGLPRHLASMRAALNQLSTDFLNFKVRLGEALQGEFKRFMSVLGLLMKSLTENIGVIKKITKALLVLVKAFILYKSTIKLVAFFTRLFTSSTVTSTAAMYSFSTAASVATAALASFRSIMLTSGIGAFAVAIGFIVERIIRWKAEQRELNKSISKTEELLSRQAFYEFLRKEGLMDKIGGFETVDMSEKAFKKLSHTIDNIPLQRVRELKGYVSELLVEEERTLKTLQEQYKDLGPEMLKSHTQRSVAFVDWYKRILARIKEELGDDIFGGEGGGFDDNVNKLRSAAPRTFNINIGTMIEDFGGVHSATLKEGADEVGETIKDTLAAALSDLQRAYSS